MATSSVSKVKPPGKRAPQDDDISSKENSVKRPKTAQNAEPATATTDEDAAAQPDQPGADAGRVGSGRQAAQGKTYKEKSKYRNNPSDLVAVASEAACEFEEDALKETAAADCGSSDRRLLDFTILDSRGEPQAVDRLNFATEPCYLSGVIYPAEGARSKDKGRCVNKFGPITQWRINYTAPSAQIVLQTDKANYTLLQPAACCRKLFAHLSEQAAICFAVHHALAPQAGGNPESSLEEVIAKLGRAKVGKSYPTPREALLLNGNFVLSQLSRLDAAAGGKATFCFANLTFTTALKSEVASLAGSGPRSNGIVIRDMAAGPTASAVLEGKPSAEDLRAQADEDYARQLQAKMDAEEYRGRGRKGAREAYVRISEAEIADDYPPPKAYEKEDEETDELLLADESMDVDPEYLPRQLLSDFSVYNSEGLLSTLELVPMWSGVDPDMELFASGLVLDDDGEWAGGQALDTAAGEGGSGGGSSGANGGSGVGATGEALGMRLYLSQIREWVVECSADMLFISIRTDVAWYRLSQPAIKYAPWYSVVLKAARVAVKIIQMLAGEARASRLSFSDIVKRLAELPAEDACHVGKKPASVERFLTVHGQILLNQLKAFPNKAVQQAAFVGSLRQAMESRRHCKLWFSVPKPTKAAKVNSNPMRDRASVRAKPMTATATTMVKRIWQSYFVNCNQAQAPEEEEAAEAAPTAQEVEEDVNDEDDEAAEEDALQAVASPKPTAPKAEGARKPASKLAWMGDKLGTTLDPRGKQITLYRSAKLGDQKLELGDVFAFSTAESDSVTPSYGMVHALGETSDGRRLASLRVLAHGCETVLGDAASDAELFLTQQFLARPAETLGEKVAALRLQRDWDPSKRLEHAAQDDALAERNARAAAEGKPLEYFWRSLYIPEEGMFAQAPSDLGLGTFRFEEPQAQSQPRAVATEGGLALHAPAGPEGGVEYRAGDCVFLDPEAWGQCEGAADQAALPDYAASSRYHKTVSSAISGSHCRQPGGTNAGLRAFAIGRITAVKFPRAAKAAGVSPEQVTLTVNRFYRPEDVSRDRAYTAGFWEVYASTATASVTAGQLEGKCTVVKAGPGFTGRDNIFVCTHTFDRKSGDLSDPPTDLPSCSETPGIPTVPEPADKGKGTSAADAKGKGKAVDSAGKGKAPAQSGAADERPTRCAANGDGVSLATMDIFAGCGGLSEGLHQERAAYTRWAIEYEGPAAEAFKLNHPDATVWCDNCNVILTAAMAKANLQADCQGSQEAVDAAGKLSDDVMASIPGPGEVEFLCGGPPCQGYSGMNRFNKGNWSMVQNSMVMAYLSFADFYRPRYFLLENVRNFVSHNKSFTFRLTLRSLLDMGFQVRFGVLNAGNFGVSQSRKRTFIWGVAPGNPLPPWPAPQHVFRSPQLTISLPGGVKYCAVPTRSGAPLRAVTVRDVIADLPPVENGTVCVEAPYSGAPVSAFQRKIRGDCAVLTDHICKEMNELNLERCRCIPKGAPGADWRVLQQIVKDDPSREKFKGQPLVPWCLPNTADRHNGWRGLFGRLDWNGHFPTSTTDPQPMGKVGQVFHPDQDRIVSVRECARAQGFPDSFRFYGNVHNKHRQIGNAVPPPLAAALGRQLRSVLEKKAEADAKALLEAQMRRP